MGGPTHRTPPPAALGGSGATICAAASQNAAEDMVLGWCWGACAGSLLGSSGRVALVVVCAVLALTLLSVARWDRRRRYPPRLVRHVTETVREAARLGVSSEQDAEPLLALIHSTAALSHVRVARGIMGDADIERGARCNPEELELALKERQAAAMQRLAERGVQISSPHGMGPATGWLGRSQFVAAQK